MVGQSWGTHPFDIWVEMIQVIVLQKKINIFLPEERGICLLGKKRYAMSPLL
jgi:hypothetical protein